MSHDTIFCLLRAKEEVYNVNPRISTTRPAQIISKHSRLLAGCIAPTCHELSFHSSSFFSLRTMNGQLQARDRRTRRDARMPINNNKKKKIHM